MQVKWTAAHVRTAKKILKRHEDLNAALPDLSKAIGWEVSVNALEKAFRRNRQETPLSFLKTPKAKSKTPREELIARIEQKDAKRKRHQQALTDIIVEKVEAAVASVEPSTIVVNPIRAPKKDPDVPPELIWCEISDVQLGTKVDAESMGGINEHDWRMFLRKLDAWKARTIATITERQAVCPLEGIVLAMIGDIVEGHGIFKGQVYELDTDVYRQVMKGAEDFAQAFAEICATFPQHRFTLYAVGGNHGRVGGYGEAPYRCNWDLILYRFIEMRLKAAGVKNIECHIPEAWFQVVETWGWTHLLVHGDDVKGWGGLPFYGLQRHVAKYNQVLQRPINYLHIGHFHAEAGISSSLGDCIVNGNWIGANSFSKQIIEANTPVQLIHGITEADGIVWTRKVFLRSRVEMKPKITVYKHGQKVGRK